MIGENLDDLWFGDDFLVRTPNWISLNLKIILCERQCQENFQTSPGKGKHLAKYTPDKGLLSNIYKIS